jgi:hypothetical protein
MDMLPICQSFQKKKKKSGTRSVHWPVMMLLDIMMIHSGAINSDSQGRR